MRGPRSFGHKDGDGSGGPCCGGGRDEGKSGSVQPRGGHAARNWGGRHQGSCCSRGDPATAAEGRCTPNSKQGEPRDIPDVRTQYFGSNCAKFRFVNGHVMDVDIGADAGIGEEAADGDCCRCHRFRSDGTGQFHAGNQWCVCQRCSHFGEARLRRGAVPGSILSRWRGAVPGSIHRGEGRCPARAQIGYSGEGQSPARSTRVRGVAQLEPSNKRMD